MTKQRKPLSTKKPPVPGSDHSIIEDWMSNDVMPRMQPMVKAIDKLITSQIPNLKYAIKWGNVFYGTEAQGWLIELAAFSVSANIVFLNGAHLSPQPPLGTDDQTRYIKLESIAQVNDPAIADWVNQSSKKGGWKFES